MAATTPLNGYTTQNVKMGNDFFWGYTLTDAKELGNFAMSAASTGVWAPNANLDVPLDAANGEDLCVRVSSPINTVTAIVVTVSGLSAASGAITATATIAAGSSEDRAFTLIQAAGTKFASITGVTVTGGARNDGFDIFALPTTVTTAPYMDASTDPGETVKLIFDHYDPAQMARQRGNRRITVNDKFVNFAQGLSAIYNRNCCLRGNVRDAGQAAASEVHWITKVRIPGPLKSGGEDADATQNATGFYGKRLVFST
jgi:hypothetical protein